VQNKQELSDRGDSRHWPNLGRLLHAKFHPSQSLQRVAAVRRNPTKSPPE